MELISSVIVITSLTPLMVLKLAATRRNDENIEEKLMSISGIELGTIGSGAQHSPSYTIRAPMLIP
jgi:hypothetical protein